MSIRPLKWILLGPVLALLFLVQSFGAREWPVPAFKQPAQMWSEVDYDPELSDPFFESEEWSYPDGGQAVVYDGTWPEGEEPPRLKHTAKCFSTSFGVKHLVRFCEAKLFEGNTIELFIHESNPAHNDKLIVQIRNGMFTCHFRTYYMDMPGPTQRLTQTTKRQKLTLDKKAYKKGDVIKSKIDIEVLDELIHPEYPDRPPRLIKVYGVFKTIVE